MKSTRRHELQTNQLADRLGRSIAQLKPYSKAISGAILAVVVVMVVVMLLSRRNQKLEADAWDEYSLAVDSGTVDLDALRDIAEKYSGSRASLWARIAWADSHLQQGSAQLFRDRETANGHLKNAIAEYRALIDGSAPDLILQRAHFGLACAYEASGELERAREAYGEVNGELGVIAAQRAELLDQASVQRFYDWFAVAELPNALPGGLGTPGDRTLEELLRQFGDDSILFPETSGASDLGGSLELPDPASGLGEELQITPPSGELEPRYIDQEALPDESPTGAEAAPEDSTDGGADDRPPLENSPQSAPAPPGASTDQESGEGLNLVAPEN